MVIVRSLLTTFEGCSIIWGNSKNLLQPKIKLLYQVKLVKIPDTHVTSQVNSIQDIRHPMPSRQPQRQIRPVVLIHKTRVWGIVTTLSPRTLLCLLSSLKLWWWKRRKIRPRGEIEEGNERNPIEILFLFAFQCEQDSNLRIYVEIMHLWISLKYKQKQKFEEM